MTQKKTERIIFMASKEEKQMLVEAAEAEGMGLSSFLRKLIRDYVSGKENG